MDKRLMSVPEGIIISGGSKIRRYWYNAISDASRQRLWSLTESMLRTTDGVYIWKKDSKDKVK